MTAPIEDFLETIERVYGTYLDAKSGFYFLCKQVAQAQAQTSSSTRIPLERLDTLAYFYGRGDPNQPDAVVQHRSTQGQLKHRNRRSGDNMIFLGAMSVVSIYQFWEDRFRGEIAAELGIPRQDFKNDLLGDLRLIRIAIIHHGSIAGKEIEKCVLLKWFKEGDQITIDEDRMLELVTQLRGICFTWITQRKVVEPNEQPEG